MTWFAIIKNPKLSTSNKVTTNLGSKSESQDDNCERKVREYADKVGNYSKTGSNLDGHSSLNYMPVTLPEEVWCKILSQLNRIQPNNEISESVEVNGVEYEVEVLYYYYPRNEEASMLVKVDDYTEGKINFDSLLYFSLDFINRDEGLSEEEALKKVDFR
jgi:hypothetical protein